MAIVSSATCQVGRRCNQHCAKAHPGDYLFLPAGVPHVAVNRGSAAAVFVGARNEPTAQESVIMLPELNGAVP
jgi:uncharacterized RmlC-like cupin family protein